MRRASAALVLSVLALAACGKGGRYDKRELGGGVWQIRNADGVFKYLSAESAKEAGIGVRIGKGAAGEIAVLEVFPGSPAQGAGLQVGDQLLTLNEAPLKRLSPDEAAAKIKGPPGSTVQLIVQRQDKTLNMALARAKDVMQFTEFPPGTSIRNFEKASFAGGVCPEQKDAACHFLIESGPVCFYSCPL